ncbi:hypothetical protein [Streptomyces sp. JNUCC 63]
MFITPILSPRSPIRRIGSTPAERGSTGYNNCPDVIQLDDGDFAVIGYRARRRMPDLDAKLATVGASVNVATETVVIVPRDCILAAANAVPPPAPRLARTGEAAPVSQHVAEAGRCARCLSVGNAHDR